MFKLIQFKLPNGTQSGFRFRTGPRNELSEPQDRSL